MAAGTKKTMRRVPQDLAEAKFISDRITEYLGAHTVELATAGKHTELHTIIGYDLEWKGIVADLNEGPLALPMAPPVISEPNLGVHVPLIGNELTPQPEGAGSVATDANANAEGGARNRTARQKTA